MKLDGSKLAIFSCGLDDGSSICSSLDSPVSPTPGVGIIYSLPPPTPNLIKIRSPHLLPIWKHYFRGHVRSQDECIINWPISNSSTKIKQTRQTYVFWDAPDRHWMYSYRHYSCEFKSRSWRDVLYTTLWDKFCPWLTAGRRISPGTQVSSTNKTERQDIAKILLKVALNSITVTLY
jgi:hypothetical protein